MQVRRRSQRTSEFILCLSSLLFGNLFVFFEFRGETSIPESIRNRVYAVLTTGSRATFVNSIMIVRFSVAVGVIGTLLLLVLRKPAKNDDEQHDKPTASVKDVFCKATAGTLFEHLNLSNV